MKKVLIALFVLLTVAASVITFSTGNEKVSSYEKKIEIDKTQDISFDFKDYTVKVKKWNNRYVKVSSNIYDNKRNYEVIASGNRISVRNINGAKENKTVISSWTWLPLMQIKEYQDRFFETDSFEYNFVVYVPKNTPVQIYGKYIRTDGCTVSYVEGGEAEIRDSVLTKDFKEKVSTLTVRDCEIPKNVQLGNGDIRDNKIID